MKIRIVYILLFILTGQFFSGYSQDPVEHIWQQVDSINRNLQVPAAVEKISPWSFNTTVGTSMAWVPGFGSAMNMFVAPHASYSATDRLTMSGGIMASRSLPQMVYSEENLYTEGGLSSMAFFISASYRLTENLIVHGTGIKSISLLPMNETIPAFDFQDISVGATYNFGNFSIGASFHRSDNSFMNSPFGFGSYMPGAPLLR